MRKLVFRVLLALILVFFLGLIGVFFWLRGDGFRDWARVRIDSELLKYNICLKAEKIDIDPLRFQARLENVEISVCSQEQPVATLRQLFVQMRAKDLLARKFELKELAVEEPKIYVRFDKEGRSNFSAIRLPETKGDGSSQLTSAVMIFDNGQIYYDDQRIDLGGQLGQFTVGVRPGDGGSNQITVQAQKSELKYEGRAFNLEQFTLRTKLFKDRAEVESLTFDTGFGKGTLSGNVSDWRALNYDLNLYLKLDLNAATRIFAPGRLVAGSTTVRGHVTGQGKDYRFQGQVESADLSGYGMRAASLDLKADIAPSPNLFLLSGDLRLGGARYDRVEIKAFRSPIHATRQSIELSNFEVVLLGGKARGSADIALGGNGLSRVRAGLEDFDLGQITDLALKRPVRLTGKIGGKVDLSWPGLNFKAIGGDLTTNFNGSTLPSAQYPQAVPLNGEIAGRISGTQMAISRGVFSTAATRLSVSGTAGLQALKLNVDLESQNIEEARQIADQIGLQSPPAEGTESGDSSQSFNALGRATFNGTVEGSPKNPSVQGQIFVEQLVSGQEEIGRFSGRVRYSPSEIVVSDGQLAQKKGGEANINFSTSLAEEGGTTANLRFKAFQIPQSGIQAARKYALKKSLLPLYSVLKNFDGEVSGEIDLGGLPGAKKFRSGEKIDQDKLLKQIDGRLDLNIKNSHPEGSFRSVGFQFAVRDEQLNFSRILLGLPSGTITGTANYDTRTTNFKLDLASEKIDLAEFSESMKQRGLPASGIVSVRLSGRGDKDKPVFNLNLASQQFSIGKTVLRDFGVGALIENGVANLDLKGIYKGKPYQLDGRIKLTDNLPIEADATFNDKSIVPFVELFFDIPPRLEMIGSGSLKIRGPLSTDDGISLSKVKLYTDLDKLTLQVQDSEEGGVDYTVSNDGPVSVEIGTERLSFKKFNLKGGGTSFTVAGNIVYSGASALDLKGQINLKLLNTLSKSLFIDGIANVNATIGGPSGFSGSADLKDLSIRYIGFPISLQEGNGRILFASNKALIENFVAKSGNGQLHVDGGLVFDKLRPDRFRLSLKADGVRVNYPRSVRSLVDGDLVLQGSPKLQVLTGSVNVRRAEYTDDVNLGDLLLNSGQVGQINLGATDAPLVSTLSLDVAVTAQDSLVVRNNLADVVGSASMKLTGSASDPIISGRAVVSRGLLFLRNDRYNVTRGIIDFPETRNGRARFDLEADTDLRGYRIILNAVGTLMRFNTTLRSEPSLPQSDIISLLTTGQLPQPGVSNKALESQTRLGPAVSILGDILSERVEQRTGRLFGLNRFQIDPLLAGRGSDPTARITLGRRVTKDLSLTYSANVTTGQEQIIVIEYQVNRNISVIGTRDQDGSYGFDVRFRKRF